MEVSSENTSQEYNLDSPNIDADQPESNRNNLTTIASNDIAYKHSQVSDDSLDNRKPNGLYREITRSSSGAVAPLSSSPRSALTLANNHPLMFTESASVDHDSDSEEKPLNVADQITQPLRLDQPLVTNPAMKDTVTSFSSKLTLSTLETNQLLNLVPNSQGRDKEILDFGSSDDDLDVASEPDISQYEANVNPHYQSVVLVSRPDHHPQPTTNFQRKISVSADLLSDSMSSLDSISQNSFDEELETNLVSVSISSSVLDDTGFNATTDGAVGGLLDNVASPVSLPTDHMATPIPQYSATDEARDTRSWQKITLPDGRTREIDMKVIEPYKRVLSHGGYLKSGGHNAIVVFSACHLPDRSRKDYHYVMDNLFL